MSCSGASAVQNIQDAPIGRRAKECGVECRFEPSFQTGYFLLCIYLHKITRHDWSKKMAPFEVLNFFCRCQQEIRTAS